MQLLTTCVGHSSSAEGRWPFPRCLARQDKVGNCKVDSGSWWGSVGSDQELADCKPGAWHALGAEGSRGLELWGHGVRPRMASPVPALGGLALRQSCSEHPSYAGVSDPWDSQSLTLTSPPFQAVTFFLGTCHSFFMVIHTCSCVCNSFSTLRGTSF